MHEKKFEAGSGEENASGEAKFEEPLYDPAGKVKSPETAREMAEEEEKYRKARFWGLLRSSEARIRKGEISAEDKVEYDPDAHNLSSEDEDAILKAVSDYPEVDIKQLRPLSLVCGNMGGGSRRCRLKGFLSFSNGEARQVIISIIVDPRGKASVERMDKLKNLSKPTLGDPERF